MSHNLSITYIPKTHEEQHKPHKPFHKKLSSLFHNKTRVQPESTIAEPKFHSAINPLPLNRTEAPTYARRSPLSPRTLQSPSRGHILLRPSVHTSALSHTIQTEKTLLAFLVGDTFNKKYKKFFRVYAGNTGLFFFISWLVTTILTFLVFLGYTNDNSSLLKWVSLLSLIGLPGNLHIVLISNVGVIKQLFQMFDFVFFFGNIVIWFFSMSAFFCWDVRVSNTFFIFLGGWLLLSIDSQSQKIVRHFGMIVSFFSSTALVLIVPFAIELEWYSAHTVCPKVYRVGYFSWSLRDLAVSTSLSSFFYMIRLIWTKLFRSDSCIVLKARLTRVTHPVLSRSSIDHTPERQSALKRPIKISTNTKAKTSKTQLNVSSKNGLLSSPGKSSLENDRKNRFPPSEARTLNSKHKSQSKNDPMNSTKTSFEQELERGVSVSNEYRPQNRMGLLLVVADDPSTFNSQRKTNDVLNQNQTTHSDIKQVETKRDYSNLQNGRTSSPYHDFARIDQVQTALETQTDFFFVPECDGILIEARQSLLSAIIGENFSESYCRNSKAISNILFLVSLFIGLPCTTAVILGYDVTETFARVTLVCGIGIFLHQLLLSNRTALLKLMGSFEFIYLSTVAVIWTVSYTDLLCWDHRSLTIQAIFFMLILFATADARSWKEVSRERMFGIACFVFLFLQTMSWHIGLYPDPICQRYVSPQTIFDDIFSREREESSSVQYNTSSPVHSIQSAGVFLNVGKNMRLAKSYNREQRSFNAFEMSNDRIAASSAVVLLLFLLRYLFSAFVKRYEGMCVILKVRLQFKSSQYRI